MKFYIAEGKKGQKCQSGNNCGSNMVYASRRVKSIYAILDDGDTKKIASFCKDCITKLRDALVEEIGGES